MRFDTAVRRRTFSRYPIQCVVGMSVQYARHVWRGSVELRGTGHPFGAQAVDQRRWNRAEIRSTLTLPPDRSQGRVSCFELIRVPNVPIIWSNLLGRYRVDHRRDARIDLLPA
jgi:hypothetical protein